MRADTPSPRNARQRERYNADPAYRERVLAGNRARQRTGKYKAKQRVAGALIRISQRIQCLIAYGTVCACCGEDHYEFLAVDHIHGKGHEHRAALRRAGTVLYRWLVKNNFPPGFRVLCHNCNSALGFYGYCPHERER